MYVHGPSRPRIVLALVASLGLAGCFGSSSSGDGSDENSESQDERPSAEVPDKDSFSIAVESLSLDDAFRQQGVENEITVRLSDNLNNTAIPDGTRVNFTSSRGGSVDTFCETSNSACSVTWTRTGELSDAGPANTTGNPRDPGCGQVRLIQTETGITATPGDNCRRPNRITVMAWVEGQETFTDTNANGFFDDGDIFNAADDLPDPFRDDNENGARDDGEVFADYPCGISTECGDIANYDLADGLYAGPDCAHSTLCADQQRTFVFGNATFAIPNGGIDITITDCAGNALTSSNANGPISTVNVPPGGSRGVCFIAYDDFGNPVPDGTTVSYDAGDTLDEFSGDEDYGDSNQVTRGNARLVSDGTSETALARITLSEPNGDTRTFEFTVSD